jgi:hypothetical protein
MKTYKEILNEGLPPHLQDKFGDKSGSSVKDVTPSFAPDKYITVYGMYRDDAIKVMRKEKIKFISTGSSSGKFRFNDEKIFNKALNAFKQSNIKVADAE